MFMHCTVKMKLVVKVPRKFDFFKKAIVLGVLIKLMRFRTKFSFLESFFHN